MPPQRLKRGFGLLEVILVFAILIGAAAIVFSVFKSAQTQAQASTAVDQMNLLVTNTRTYLDANLNSNGLAPFGSGGTTSSYYHAMGILPTSMVNTPEQYGSNGSSIFGPINFGGSTVTAPFWLIVQFSNVPQDACELMIPALYAQHPTVGGRAGVFVNSGGITSAQYAVTGPGGAVCGQDENIVGVMVYP